MAAGAIGARHAVLFVEGALITPVAWKVTVLFVVGIALLDTLSPPPKCRPRASRHSQAQPWPPKPGPQAQTLATNRTHDFSQFAIRTLSPFAPSFTRYHFQMLAHSQNCKHVENTEFGTCFFPHTLIR